MTTQHDPPPQADPDVGVRLPAHRRRRSSDPAVLAAIAAGGVLGAEARFGLSLVVPHSAGQWPWGTWLVNVSGCFLIGVLMVVVTELTSPHHLVRPFLGVGVLGGYTTFSTAMLDVQQLVLAGRAGTALGYLLATVAAAVLATFAGAALTRTTALRRRAGRREHA